MCPQLGLRAGAREQVALRHSFVIRHSCFVILSDAWTNHSRERTVATTRFFQWRFISSVTSLLSLKKAAFRARLLVNVSLSLRSVSKFKSWKRRWINDCSIAPPLGRGDRGREMSARVRAKDSG